MSDRYHHYILLFRFVEKETLPPLKSRCYKCADKEKTTYIPIVDFYKPISKFFKL